MNFTVLCKNVRLSQPLIIRQVSEGFTETAVLSQTGCLLQYTSRKDQHNPGQSYTSICEYMQVYNVLVANFIELIVYISIYICACVCAIVIIDIFHIQPFDVDKL